VIFKQLKQTQLIDNSYNQTVYDSLGEDERFEYLMDKLQYHFDKDGNPTTRRDGTATMLYLHDYQTLHSPRNWCSIESAFLQGLNVHVYASKTSLFDQFPEEYKSKLKVSQLDYHDVFLGTPFLKLYEEGIFNSARYKGHDITDAARLALLTKQSGIFSDLDIIYFNSDFVNTKNKIASQNVELNHPHFWNNNFLDFDKNHPFVRLLIDNYVKSYKPYHEWGSVGPGLVTDTLRACYFDKDKKIREICRSVERLDIKYFQLVHTDGVFQAKNPLPTKLGDLTKLLTTSYGYHFGNSAIGSDRIPIGSLLYTLMMNYCPKVSVKFFDDIFE
jgi:hypothetical protein